MMFGLFGYIWCYEDVSSFFVTVAVLPDSSMSSQREQSVQCSRPKSLASMLILVTSLDTKTLYKVFVRISRLKKHFFAILSISSEFRVLSHSLFINKESRMVVSDLNSPKKKPLRHPNSSTSRASIIGKGSCCFFRFIATVETVSDTFKVFMY
jgi:hypothetical protein